MNVIRSSDYMMRNVWAVISDFWMQYLSTCKEIFEIFWNSRGHICEIFGKHTPSQLAGCWQEYIWTFACCDITWQNRAESIPYQHRWICLHSEAFKASGRMSLIVSCHWFGTLNWANAALKGTVFPQMCLEHWFLLLFLWSQD